MSLGVRSLCLLIAVGYVAAFGTNCGGDGARMNGLDRVSVAADMQPNLKIVFLGDQGLGSNPIAVLNDVKAWGPHAVIHSGDFDYADNPTAWNNQINNVLGASFPYFASIGNHDLPRWTGYKQLLTERLALIRDAQCTGDIGVNMLCNYKGLLFVLSGVGTLGSNHARYIDTSFTSTAAIWKVCSWHKNQHLYQTGSKSDETGYEVYDTCRQHGAIVATAHEHSYSRTHLMSNFASQRVADTNNTLNLSPGFTFAFVSGIAGQSLRPWVDNAQKNPWWASCAATDNGVSDGALYCTFYVDNDPRKATCFFKDRKGKVWDTFNMYSKLSAETPTAPASAQCTPQSIDIQVKGSSNDAVENIRTGEVSCTGARLPLGNDEGNVLTAIRFGAVNIPKDARIKAANLQIFGRPTLKKSEARIEIRAEKATSSLPVDCRATGSLSSKPKTAASVEWSEDESEWEGGEVWVSADITSVLKEVSSQDGWVSGNAVTLYVSGRSSGYVF
eukprot:TRINITY_DN1920_c0_g1_i3.p1 TRINITY_DN1920_c0_g1~~TRINITY_DN1920_c0_g1_i3.p1  ORF type:complete len:501 (-),score=104.09 TRINITY_DN1920_c0_g1_i3:357-1859(-)